MQLPQIVRGAGEQPFAFACGETAPGHRGQFLAGLELPEHRFHGAPATCSLPVHGDAAGVVELKRGRPSDKVVGQVARYIGYVRTHLAKPGQPVEGLIIAHDADEPLLYAVAAFPGLQLMTYGITFQLKAVEDPQHRECHSNPEGSQLNPGLHLVLTARSSALKASQAVANGTSSSRHEYERPAPIRQISLTFGSGGT